MPVEELDPKPPNPLDRGGETPYNKGVHKGGTPITYQQTLQAINTLNHKLQTKQLTRQEAKALILERETLWSNYTK